MKILRISKIPLPGKALEAFSGFGMMVSDLSPALLSAMTAMKIAKAVNKEEPDVVMVDSMDNAMAAVSARNMNLKKNFRLVFCVTPNSEIPKGVPNDIAKDVDAWIFPSDRLANLYPEGLNNPTILQPVSLAGAEVARQPHSTPVIGWIGDIRYPEGLKEALEEVDAQNGRFTLRIAGAGLAKTVMPLVRLSRALVHKDNVVWVGESYDVVAETGKCDAVLHTAPDLTPVETIAVQNGIPVITAAEISTLLEGVDFTNANLDLSAATYLSSLRSRLLHISQ